MDAGVAKPGQRRRTEAPSHHQSRKVNLLPENIDWDRFRKFVEVKYSRVHANSILNYARKFHSLLSSGDLSEILHYGCGKQRHILSALACLCRFTGTYEEFRRMRERYGIKFTHNFSLNLNLDEDAFGDILFWIKNARKSLGSLSPYIDLLLASGMRPLEAVESFNLIIRLKNENKLNSYYRDGWLEHFRFQEIFCRRSKNVYVSFCPENIIQAVASSTPVTIKAIRWRLRKNKCRLKHVRKLWATFMVKYLTEPEIN
ncbi:MAG: hypothetical protein QXK19_02420, partial [Nitrososphaerota archaeon]